MTKINNFIYHSDFATLKNDGGDVLTIQLPNNITLPGNGSYSQSVSKVIGKNAAQIRGVISTTRENRLFPVISLYIGFDYGASLPFVTGVFYITKNGNQVVLNAYIPNPYSETVTLTGVGQTITARVQTFLNPFP